MIQAKDRSGKWRWKRWTIVIVFLSGIVISQTVQAVPNGGYTHPEILIQPQELKVIIDKKDSSLRIIDVREKLQYLSGHIPGAVQVWRPDIEDRKHALPGMMAAQKQV